MNLTKVSVGLVLVAGAIPGVLGAAELQPDTAKAWEQYIHNAGLRLDARLDGRKPFLWMDESPDRRRRVQRGEVVVAPLAGRGIQNVPNGLIHDWIGASFIPNATIGGLLRVVHDYNSYKEFYKPVVIDSEVLACTGAHQEFSMVWQRRVLFVNFAMQGHYKAHDIAVDAHRGYSIAEATQVQEFQDYGHAAEHLLPPDTGSGFVWRLRSIARYEEHDGGVYLELEAIALTRDIPASLRWLVSPVVNHLSINSLTATLRQTRDAVNSLSPGPEGLALCPARVRTAANRKPAGGE